MEHKISKKTLQRILYQEYGIEGEVQRAEEEYVIYDTSEGKKVLRKVRQDASDVLFDHGMMKHLKEQNFHHVLSYAFNKEEKPYIEMEGSLYVLQEYVEEEEHFLETLQEAYRFAEWIGKLHKASQGLIPQAGSKVRIDWGKWEGSFRSALIGLKKYKQMAEKQQKSFDQVFLRSADEMIAYGEKAYERLKEQKYMEYVQSEMSKNTFCIKYFSPKQFARKEGEFYIRQLNRAALDLPVWDLAEFIRIHGHKKDGVLSIQQVVKSYEEQRPLSKTEKDLLIGLLYMPTEFYKLSKRYYERGSNQEAAHLEERLERIISYERERISSLKGDLL